jgi:hypothetical protein
MGQGMQDQRMTDARHRLSFMYGTRNGIHKFVGYMSFCLAVFSNYLVFGSHHKLTELRPWWEFKKLI